MPPEPEGVFGGEGAVDPNTVWPASRFAPLVDGEVLRTEGATLRVLHVPGHADDHVALVHVEEKSMFTGDNVLGVGTTFFRDLGAYMSSLARMRATATSEGITVLHPAHGPPIPNAPEKLAEYIAHRQERVDQVRNALVDAPGEGLTCVCVAKKLYVGIPETLIRPAASNTLLALRKLESDGVVVFSGRDGRTDGPFGQRWRLTVSKL